METQETSTYLSELIDCESRLLTIVEDHQDIHLNCNYSCTTLLFLKRCLLEAYNMIEDFNYDSV